MKKTFYPIIASSLALALSANVAVAEESISETIQGLSRGGGGLTNNFDQQQTQNSNPTINFIEDSPALTWEENQGGLSAKTNEQFIEKLKFSFDGKASVGQDETLLKYKNPGNQSNPKITFTGGTRGIVLGQNGKGTMIIDLASQDKTKTRQFELNLNKSNDSFSLKGNIEVTGATAPDDRKSQFVANFNKNVIGNITLNNGTGSKLNKNSRNQITFEGDANLDGTLVLQDGELHLTLGNGTIKEIQFKDGISTANPKLFLEIEGNGSIGNINDQTKDPRQKTELDLQGNSTLSLQGNNTTFGLLKFQGANTIDLSKQTAGASKAESTRRTLTINSLDTNAGTSLTFISRVSKDGADKVIIDGKTGTGTQTYSMQVVADDTAKESKAIIATVKKEGDAGIIDLGDKAQVTQGRLTGSFKLAKTNTDKDGGTASTNYVSYKLNGLSGETTTNPTPDNKPTPPEIIYQGQQEAEYAISISTDLFLANFNSLNKRMGDLRDNANSQGVWARVFHGAQTNAFTVTESKSKYTTIQSGYDYGFTLDNGAKNYLGFALSYGHSSLSVLDTEIGKSDLVELALYNSYIEDAGWYNDTIAKFSYLMNSINLNKTELNNFAFLFSDEFGYRFKLGSNKEWFIDPQLELSIAYINGGKLKDQSVTTDIASMMILKNRLGSSFGYEFKNEKSTLKLYAGGFYEFDYFNSDISKWNGNILGHSVSGEVKNSLNNQIDHRFVLNLGMNAEIGKNTRVYFDFEKSFAGKITTDYKFNIGARYAFGQTTDKTVADDTNRAPIKLDDSKK